MDEQTSGAAHTHNHQAQGCFLCATAIPLLQHFWSDATKDHFRNSRIEFLKGMRSLIDDRIAHLSRDERKGSHVTVE